MGDDAGTRYEGVGWRVPDGDYPTGPPSSEVVERLTTHAKAWHRAALLVGDPVRVWSLQTCPLCGYEMHRRVVYVPSDDVVYTAPGLLEHYISVHNFDPPQAFKDALLSCPEPGTVEFFCLLVRHHPALASRSRFLVDVVAALHVDPGHEWFYLDADYQAPHDAVLLFDFQPIPHKRWLRISRVAGTRRVVAVLGHVAEDRSLPMAGTYSPRSQAKLASLVRDCFPPPAVSNEPGEMMKERGPLDRLLALLGRTRGAG